MNQIEIIKSDLEKGFKKTQLEKLIGLPENSLSGVLSGKKKLSRQSIIKIELWNKSEKPDPLITLHKLLLKPGTPIREIIGDINFDKPTSAAFDGAKVNRVIQDEVSQWQEPKNDKPKNLDQLKLLCPKELTGFDRSEWIRNERLKYNI